MIFLRYFLKDVFFYSVEEFELAIEQSEDAPRGRGGPGGRRRGGARGRAHPRTRGAGLSQMRVTTRIPAEKGPQRGDSRFRGLVVERF